MTGINGDRSMRYRRLLGLGPSATLDDLRRSYRREMRLWHPDRVGGDGTRARELNAARAYLVAEIRSAEHSGVKSVPVAVSRPRTHPEVTSTPARPPTGARRDAPTIRGSVHRRPRAWRNSGSSWVIAVILVYLGLLAFGVMGWIATALIPWAGAVLGH